MRPSVQLAIISRLSEEYPITKIYEMLGLCALDVDHLKQLAAKFNYQRELEDYLIYQLQKDQLEAILRTDHTSTARGSPEGFHEYLTQKYVTNIQHNIDERILQATRADINLGKLYLSRHGIPRRMVGCWDHISGPLYAARLLFDQLNIPNTPVPFNIGIESGHASAAMDSDTLPIGHEIKKSEARKQQNDVQTGQHTSPTGNPIQLHTRKIGFQREASITKLQDARPNSQSRSDTCQSPADSGTLSATGPVGRSRRNLRRTSRYQEAMAELRARGNDGETDSNYNTSDADDQDSEDSDPPMPCPCLRMTPVQQIVAIPSPARTVNPCPRPQFGTINQPPNPKSQMPTRATVPASTPPQPVMPLPLQRVVIERPKPVPKFEVPNPQPTPVAKTLTKFNQNLYGLGHQTNKFAKGLLEVSKRGPLGRTPPIPMKPEELARLGPLLATDQCRNASTVTAPAFTPLTERSSGENTARQPEERREPPSALLKTSQLQDMHGFMNDRPVPSPILTKPELMSRMTTAKSALAIRNGRSTVTEAGSPVPLQKESSSTPITPMVKDLPMSRENKRSHDQPGDRLILLSTAKTSRPTYSIPELVYQKSNPVTGKVILQKSAAHDDNSAPLLPKKALWASMVHQLRLRKPSYGTMTIPESASPFADDVSVALANKRPYLFANDRDDTSSAKRARNEITRPSDPLSTMDSAPKEKRKYSKSEAQRQKEAARRQRMKQEKTERVTGQAEKVRLGEVKDSEQATSAGGKR